MAASLCHPPRHRSAPRRRLAPASPWLPPPGLNCSPRDAPSRWEDPEKREGEVLSRGGLNLFPPPSLGVPSVLWGLDTGPCPLPAYLPVEPPGCTPRTTRRRRTRQRRLGGVSNRAAIASVPLPGQLRLGGSGAQAPLHPPPTRLRGIWGGAGEGRILVGTSSPDEEDLAPKRSWLPLPHLCYPSRSQCDLLL